MASFSSRPGLTSFASHSLARPGPHTSSSHHLHHPNPQHPQHHQHHQHAGLTGPGPCFHRAPQQPPLLGPVETLMATTHLGDEPLGLPPHSHALPHALPHAQPLPHPHAHALPPASYGGVQHTVFPPTPPHSLHGVSALDHVAPPLASGHGHGAMAAAGGAHEFAGLDPYLHGLPGFHHMDSLPVSSTEPFGLAPSPLGAPYQADAGPATLDTMHQHLYQADPQRQRQQQGMVAVNGTPLPSYPPVTTGGDLDVTQLLELEAHVVEVMAPTTQTIHFQIFIGQHKAQAVSASLTQLRSLRSLAELGELLRVPAYPFLLNTGTRPAFKAVKKLHRALAGEMLNKWRTGHGKRFCAVLMLARRPIHTVQCHCNVKTKHQNPEECLAYFVNHVGQDSSNVSLFLTPLCPSCKFGVMPWVRPAAKPALDAPDAADAADADAKPAPDAAPAAAAGKAAPPERNVCETCWNSWNTSNRRLSRAGRPTNKPPGVPIVFSAFENDTPEERADSTGMDVMLRFPNQNLLQGLPSSLLNELLLQENLIAPQFWQGSLIVRLQVPRSASLDGWAKLREEYPDLEISCAPSDQAAVPFVVDTARVPTTGPDGVGWELLGVVDEEGRPSRPDEVEDVLYFGMVVAFQTGLDDLVDRLGDAKEVCEQAINNTLAVRGLSYSVFTLGDMVQGPSSHGATQCFGIVKAAFIRDDCQDFDPAEVIRLWGVLTETPSRAAIAPLAAEKPDIAPAARPTQDPEPVPATAVVVVADTDAAPQAKPDPPRQYICANIGCGRYFTDDSNHMSACMIHLHEDGTPAELELMGRSRGGFGQKYRRWPCCKAPGKLTSNGKKYTSIPGCRLGPHRTWSQISPEERRLRAKWIQAPEEACTHCLSRNDSHQSSSSVSQHGSILVH